MAAIPDRAYNAACGHLASQLGISLAAARRKVDMKAAQDGISGNAAKLELAHQLLSSARASGIDSHAALTAQLGTVGNDEYFMTED
jgi:hypothetical protein